MSIKSLLTSWELQQELASLFNQSRLVVGDGRVTAEEKTGVPASTIRKFEDTGEISLRQFILLSHVYGDMEKLTSVFPEPTPESIDKLLSKPTVRKRGR